MMLAEKDKLVILAVGIGSIFLVGASRAATTEYGYTAFINPAAVSGIAQDLPDDEGEFIIAAWDWVARNITYDNFGTMLYFTDAGIECDNCLLPAYVVAEGSSNCVGKSAVLTSLLRTRLPPERVYMVVGRLTTNGPSGHAWVRAEYGGTWYILESTLIPPAQPWIPETSMGWRYAPDGYVNDQSFECYEPGLCIAIHANSCCPT